jgi:hypothetical protein
MTFDPSGFLQGLQQPWSQREWRQLGGCHIHQAFADLLQGLQFPLLLAFADRFLVGILAGQLLVLSCKSAFEARFNFSFQV